MQENFSEVQIRSRKLREYLTNRQSQSMNHTPQPSDSASFNDQTSNLEKECSEKEENEHTKNDTTPGERDKCMENSLQSKPIQSEIKRNFSNDNQYVDESRLQRSLFENEQLKPPNIVASENSMKSGLLDPKNESMCQNKQLSNSSKYLTPNHYLSESEFYPSLQDSKQQNLRSQDSSKIPGKQILNLGFGVCKFHLSNELTYICIKDKCGDLLCPLCLYDHQKFRHIGNYVGISEFYEKAKENLQSASEGFYNTLSRIITLERIIEKKENFDLRFAEQLNRTEENVIDQIKFFFSMIRKEVNNDVFLDYTEMIDVISDLHLKLNSTIQDLISEWGVKDQKSSIVFNHSSEEAKRLVKKDYNELDSSLNLIVGEIEKKIVHWKSIIQKDFQPEIEINPIFSSKLNLLLQEGIKIKRINSVKPGSNPLPFRQLDQMETNEDIILYYKELQKIPTLNEEQDKKLRSSHPRLDIIEEQIESPQRASETESQKKHRSKTVSPLRRSSDFLKTQRISHTSTLLKELSRDSLNTILNYFMQNYNNPRIKVFGPEFFENLLQVEGPLAESNLIIESFEANRVSQLLTVKSTKHKTIFSAYEKIFFLLNLKETTWLLIEVKTNPKTIILYDFLAKALKTQLYENIFDIIFQIIRLEYKGKLNQSADNFMWERKVSLKPTLVVKNDSDSGIVSLKLISNSYFNKEFSGNRISSNEIALLRKKLEKILKLSAEYTRGIGKVIIVQCVFSFQFI